MQSKAGEPWVAIQLTPVGTQKFAEFTAQHIAQPVAIFIDGHLASAPDIRSHNRDGVVVITGRFTEAEARDLANSIVPTS
ncbi:MAG: hypothetical protein IT365_23980 [Candidatus Hydrogenedentes bacterium]|nr:hypothetical protein [Candidatus Hydrogenedentota bacterium]